MRVQDQDKSNCDLAYMASFWRETNWSEHKKELNGELMVWRTKVEAMVQGCSLLCFVALFQ
jgi:hypothetical protein